MAYYYDASHLIANYKNPDEYFKLVEDNIVDHFRSQHTYKHIIEYALSHPEHSDKFNNIYSTFIANYGTKFYHPFDSTEFPKSLKKLSGILNDKSKDAIINHAMVMNSNGVVKKTIIDLAIEYLPQDDGRALEILRKYKRIISPKSFHNLISKVQDGFNNSIVKEILSTTKLFGYLEFNKDNISGEKREKFIKTLAQTPTLIKRLEFDVNLTLEDLKLLPPANRFGFMQFCYDHYLSHISYTYSRGSFFMEARANNVLNRRHLSHLKVNPIPLDDIKELLFAVSIQKNDEVNKWISKYNIYYKLSNGLDITKEDTKSLFPYRGF